MNRNGTTGPIPIAFQNANPLIFTLPQEDTSIRPYWMMVVQIIAAQTVHRAVQFLTKRSGFTAVEVGLICWMVRANVIIQEKVLEPLVNVISIIMEEDLATQHHLQTTTRVPILEPQRSNPRTVIYVICSFIVAKNIISKKCKETSDRRCANQQRIEKLKKIHAKYYKKLRFSSTDCLHALPLLGHIIWFCIKQPSCMSAEHATLWSCYNAFGYRLYNYIFPSYFHFVCTFLMKCVYRNKINEDMARGNTKKMSKLRKITSYYPGLYSSVITFIFVSCILLPFFLTHIIPMVCTYVFIHIIYWSPVFLVLICGGYFVHLPCIIEIQIKVASVFIGAVILYSFPPLISLTYNYSQYLFYGDDYFGVPNNEYFTRDTPTYTKLLQNSVTFLFHTILNFF